MAIFSDISQYISVFRKYIGRRLYIIFVLTLLGVLAEGFGIALLLPLLQATETSGGVADGHLQRTLHELLAWMGIGDSVVLILLFIGVVFAGKGLLRFTEGAYNGYLQARLIRQLKGSLFDRYSTMEYRYYLKNNTGHFINVINGQVDGFYSSFLSFTGFLSTAITTVIYFAIAFAVAWQFALMAVVIGLLLLALFSYLNKYVRELSRRASRESSQLNKLLVQALHGFKYIASTAQTPHLRKGIRQSIRKYTGYRLRQKMAGALTSSLKEPISVFFIIGVVVIQVAVFEAAIAPIFVALILFHRGMQSMITVQSGWQKTMDKIGCLEMVDTEFKALRDYHEKSGSEKIGAFMVGIDVRNVSFAYHLDDGYVLRDLSLSIPARTTVALVGESGAGKSTLVDLLTLMLRPQEGEILIDGVAGPDINLYSWRSQIGFVAQETVVFDDTIANNICLWQGDYRTDDDIKERVRKAAEGAYAHSFIDELTDGYETVVGDRGVRLSGGQRQRLFIARELFKNPNLLIMDEATSALDSESERYIQQSIDALKGSMTVVIIAHRLSTIRNVDYLYVLDHGRVVEEGSYLELAGRESSRFRGMVEMQSL